MKLGTENRKQTIVAIVLGVLFLAIAGYEVMNTFSTNASSTNTSATSIAEPTPAKVPHTGRHAAGLAAGKKTREAQALIQRCTYSNSLPPSRSSMKVREGIFS